MAAAPPDPAGLAAAWLAVAIEAVSMDQLRLKKYRTALPGLATSGTIMLIALHSISAHVASAVAAAGVGLFCWFEGLPFTRRRIVGYIVGFSGLAASLILDGRCRAPPAKVNHCTTTNQTEHRIFWVALTLTAAWGIKNAVGIAAATTRPTKGTRAGAVLGSVASSVMVTAASITATRANPSPWPWLQLLVFVATDVALAAASLKVNAAQLHAPAAYIGWELGTIAVDEVILGISPNRTALFVQTASTIVAVALMFSQRD